MVIVDPIKIGYAILSLVEVNSFLKTKHRIKLKINIAMIALKTRDKNNHITMPPTPPT